MKPTPWFTAPLALSLAVCPLLTPAAHAATTLPLTVTAHASLVDATGAAMTVRVDGAVVGTTAVTATHPTAYTFQVPAGTDLAQASVDVFFGNDAYWVDGAGVEHDRNLYVDSVSLGTTTLGFATATRDRGDTLAEATDGIGAAPATSAMLSNNGALRWAGHPAATPSPAPATPDATVEASPHGTGTDCSAQVPCDVAAARVRASQYAAAGVQDVVVHLQAGTYALPQTLDLGPADSGQNGHRVTWTGDGAGRTVIDSRTPVTGWTLDAAASAATGQQVYRTQLPAGTSVRELYVDGVSAPRASVAAAALGTWTKNAARTGYVLTNRTQLGSSVDLTGAELVWWSDKGSNVDWQGHTERRGRVASGTNGAVELVQPFAQIGDMNAAQGIGLPTSVENKVGLISGPGQYVIDRSGALYYAVAAGDDPAHHTILRPTIDGPAIRITDAEKITVENLTVSGTTFSGPDQPEGFMDFQANFYRLYSGALASPPGAIQVNRSGGVIVRNATIADVGGAGIEFGAGTHDSLIDNNEVTRTGSTGIQVGGVNSPTLDLRLRVTNNRVHEIATQYSGGIGIFAGYVGDSTFWRNTVWKTPYTGLSLGWGWGNKSELGGNVIDNNTFKDTMQELFDGGPIYVMGNGSTTNRSTISNNFIVGDHKFGGAVYVDGSARGWDIAGNTMRDVSTNWIYLQDVEGSWALDNTVHDNCTTTAQLRINSSDTNRFWSNTVSAQCGEALMGYPDSLR